MMSIGVWDVMDAELCFWKALQPSRCHNLNSQLNELSISTAEKAHITGYFTEKKKKDFIVQHDYPVDFFPLCFSLDYLNKTFNCY